MNSIKYRANLALRSLRGKGALDILGGSFLMKGAAFLGSIVLVKVMSKDDYGVLGYMENLYTYAYLFAGLGLNNAVFRYAVLKEDAEEKAGVIRFVLRAGTAFNVLYFLLLCIAARVFPHRAAFAVASSLLPIMLLGIPLQFMFDTGTYSLRALFQNRAYALFAVAAVSCIWISKIAGSSIAGLSGTVLTWPLTYGLLSFLVLAYVFRRCLGGVKPMSPASGLKKEMLGFSLQYMVTNGLWAMFLQNDLLLIGMLLGDASSVATYKVAYAIPAAMSIFSNSIGMFVAPYFVRNESNQEWVWRNYRRVLGLSILGLGALTAVIALICQPVVSLLYGDQYLDAVSVMRILLLAVLISNAIRYTASNLLAAMGKVQVNLVVSAIGMVLQIVLDFLLIPSWGIEGCAWGSVIVYTLMAIAVTCYFIWRYRPASH